MASLLVGLGCFGAGVVCGVGGLLVYLLFVQPSQYRGAGPVRSD